MGRGLFGELGDRGAVEHGALGGPDALPDRRRAPRPPAALAADGSARGVVGTVDGDQDLAERDRRRRPRQAIATRRPSRARDQPGPFN